MNRVHDLPDSGWFAMKPNPSWYDDDGDEEAPAEPEVGDVLANTRTPDDLTAGYLIDGAPEWADPPFVRVVDVLSIVSKAEWHRKQDWLAWCIVLDEQGGAHLHEPTPGKPHRGQFTAIDLPGAQPGGWAVRVEPANTTGTGAWVNVPDFPPPTGRPLNEQENTR